MQCQVLQQADSTAKVQCNTGAGQPFVRRCALEHAAVAADTQEQQDCEVVNSHEGGMLPVANAASEAFGQGFPDVGRSKGDASE